MSPFAYRRWVYALPVLHLCACFIGMLAYLAPTLHDLGYVWTYMMFVDFPISLVALALWNYSALATAWILVAGTLWWYLLSRGAKFVFQR